jgi:hypothetical protein
VGHDQAPRCKSVARADDYLLFGGIVEDGIPQIDAVSFPIAAATTTFNLTSHGLAVGQAVVFWGVTASTLTGITEGKIYYVKSVPTSSTFTLAADPRASASAISYTVTVVAQTLYMGRQKLTELKNRVRQSFPGIGFSSPASFYADAESDVIQVGKAQENFVVLCKQGLYRVEGRFSEQGQGGMVLKKISDKVGGVSALGGITVNDLFYFCGQDGFYVTDGYKVNLISPHLKERHKGIVSSDLFTYSAKNNFIQAAYDRIENRIAWTVDPDGTGYPTSLFVMHLNHTTTERGSLTEWKNSTNFAPTAVGYFRGQLLRGDYQGFVFKHDSSYTFDYKITRASTGTLTTTGVAIPFKYRALPEDFGDRGLRKWVSKVLLQFTNNGSLTMALKSVNDKATSLARSLKSIRYRSEYSGIIKEKRTFPAGAAGTGYQGFRCHTKQLQMESDSSAILYGSDDYALLTSVGAVATLASGNWPTPLGLLLDFNIYLETDSYVTGYPITAVSTNQLTATALPNVTGKKWIIKGAPRTETPEILSYSLYSASIESQPTPPSGDSGGNT